MDGLKSAHVFLIPSSGGEPKLLTHTDGSYWHSWSPDGKPSSSLTPTPAPSISFPQPSTAAASTPSPPAAASATIPTSPPTAATSTSVPTAPAPPRSGACAPTELPRANHSRRSVNWTPMSRPMAGRSSSSATERNHRPSREPHRRPAPHVPSGSRPRPLQSHRRLRHHERPLLGARQPRLAFVSYRPGPPPSPPNPVTLNP